MKHTIITKFIAILLAACTLVLAVGCAVGVAILGQTGLYMVGNFEAWKASALEDQSHRIAALIADRYAAEEYSDLPESLREVLSVEPTDKELSEWYGLEQDGWSWWLETSSGTPLASGGMMMHDYDYVFSFPLRPTYLAFSTDRDYDIRYGDDYLLTKNAPEVVVRIAVEEAAFSSYSDISMSYIQQFYSLRYGLIALLVGALLLFTVAAVYLCCAAGRSGRSPEVSPGGLNRLPLDVYLAAAGTGCFLLVGLAITIYESWFLNNESYNLGALALAAIVLIAAALLGIGFFFALAAQIKMQDFYWWTHSLVGWCCCKLWQGLRFLSRGLWRLLNLLPLIWKWLLLGGAMGAVPLLFLFFTVVGRSYWLLFLLLAVLADIVIVCYGAYGYGTLLSGAQRLAQGDLTVKIPTQYLLGTFRQCADALNALADVATVAAKKQLKSERMKTELITNVSHDIKTPLTSMINYVDLLQKPHTPQEGQQYLEVLSRQSQRMKKLIDDLMEMSKATTGNMAVEIGQLDAVEALNQALGEFSDKLAAVQLTPVFRQPEAPVTMLADGRLTWRVLSNLLSNIVKYALPGTRMYADLTAVNGHVLISLKNISREPLNVSADELTERFVRGDASRNTEGSGLGLNIAKSLMELQKGQLELLVDGDLFKVTLFFPAG